MTALAVRIDGIRLRADRDALEYTRVGLMTSVFEKTGRSISESTIRRAEEESRIGLSKLKLIAQVLGHPPSRYLTTEGEMDDPAILDISGWWTVYYREDDIHAENYVARERLHIVQRGHLLEGVYEPGLTDHPEGHRGLDVFTMTGHIGSDIVYGSYARGSPSAHGSGVFQIKFLRDGGWGEGVCSFVGDDAQIMVSLNIWIKEDHDEYRLMKTQAERLIQYSPVLLSFPISPFARM